MSCANSASLVFVSCPPPVDVTITENQVYYDGRQMNYQDEYFAYGDVTEVTTGAGRVLITLSFVPWDVDNLLFIRGSAPQRNVTDFTVSGNHIFLKVPLTPDENKGTEDIIKISYLAASDASAPSESVGDIKGLVSTTVPTGWLLMDGTTVYTRTDYPYFSQWLVDQGISYAPVITGKVVSMLSATQFTLALVMIPYTLSGVVSELPAIIKISA